MFRRLHCLLIALVLLVSASVRAQTSKGTDFWTAYMEHIGGVGVGNNSSRPSKMVLYITSDVSTTGQVEFADGSATISFAVTANDVTTLQMPPAAHMKGEGQFLKGIHITSLRPIAVYAHIFAESVSGATLVLPVNSIGKEYYSINYTQKSNANDPANRAYSTFAIIGVEDDTKVEITPSQVLRSNHPPKQPFRIVLQKGEVYQGESLYDLTGTRIRSYSDNDEDCKKIAVYSGSTKLGIGCEDLPNSQFSSDNVFQQDYPVTAWGKKYITVPLKNRNYDVIRVFLSDPNTKVILNGASVSAPASGNYIEFNSSRGNTIEADKPIQVAQYAVTQGRYPNNCVNKDNSDLGDPEMIFLNPVEQTIEKVTLYSASNYKILRNYINVVIKNEGVASFVLDGRSYTSFLPVPNNLGYSYAQIEVSAGVHNISSSVGFNAISYGFGDFESYGYSAGASLTNLNEQIVLTGVQTNSRQIVGCANVDYGLQILLPYQTNKIEWHFNDGSPDFIDNNPVATTELVNGETVYKYNYPKKVNYAPGNYTIKASVNNITNSANCGSKLVVQFDFNIATPPTAAFKFDTGCFGTETAFTDQSDFKESTGKAWLWDFGDGQTSAEQSPHHLYIKAGTYNVTLTVTNANGCAETSPAQAVVIKPIPVFDFTASNPICEFSETVFTAQSNNNTDIDVWEIDYGDGSPVEESSDGVFKHVFNKAGNYNVSLRLRTKSGCYSEPQQKSIQVFWSTRVDFDLPEICVNDVAQFNNKTTTQSGEVPVGAAYVWEFGDGSKSTEINPSHQYKAPGVYHVKLTALNVYQCEQTLTKDITVNGDIITGSIGVVNRNNLCSTQQVEFLNNTKLNSGDFVRLDMYFDVDGQPSQKTTYTRAEVQSGGIKHLYSAFTSPQTQSYHIKMVVYAGQDCSETFEDNITLYAIPEVELSPAANVVGVCQNDVPLVFTQNTHGWAGRGTFAGTGITADGVFDPKLVEPGNYPITYTFITDKGCNYQRTFTVRVDATPQVAVSREFTVFKNKEFIIPVTASGNNLTYKWSPAEGLSADDVLQPAVKVAAEATYSLTVYSGECSVTINNIHFVAKDNFTFPNTFTPNGDGINDTWKINLVEFFPGSLMSIYNRNGVKVYESKGYAVPWDGTRNGAPLPAGTYYYVFNTGDGGKPNTGYVTILR